MNKIVITAPVVVAIIIGLFFVTYDFEDKIADTIELDQKQSIRAYAEVGHSLGSSEAPVTIIEFGDYQCTSCDRWFLNEKPIIEKEYFSNNKVNMIFIDFPFQGDDSYIAAEATWCAHDQGKYFEYHSNLYVNQGNLEDGWANNESLKMYAKYLDLNTEEFNECLDSKKYSDKVLYNKNVGSSNGVDRTPTFFIIGPDGFSEKIQGPQPAAVFMNIIDQLS